jgi:hypothetical protein
MDDLQDSPEEIPGLYNMITTQLWLGIRLEKKRYDSVVAKNIPSKLFNSAKNFSTVKWFQLWFESVKCRQKNVEVSGEMHRYIPVLAKMLVLENREKVVQHR